MSDNKKRNIDGSLKAKKFNNNHKSKSKSPNKNYSNTTKKEEVPSKRTKPNKDIATALNKIWEQARLKNISKDDRIKYVEKMYEKMKTKVHSLAMKHDSSRAVQFVMQYGSDEIFMQLFNEIQEHVIDMSISPYGHFVILMVIQKIDKNKNKDKNNNTSKSYISKFLASFRGRFRKVASNATGSKIAQSIFSTFKKDVTNNLRAEIYGQQALLLSNLDDLSNSNNNSISGNNNGPTLHQVISRLTNDEKKIAEVEKFAHFIETLLGKEGTLDHSYVHELVNEVVVASAQLKLTSTLTLMMELLIPHTKRIIASSPGAHAMALLIQLTTSKERKKVLKSLKGYVLESLLHKYAYIVICRIVEVTDDTVLVQKVIFDELKTLSQDEKDKKEKQLTATGEEKEEGDAPLLQLAKSSTGSLVISLLLHRGTGQGPSPIDTRSNSSNSSSMKIAFDDDYAHYGLPNSKKDVIAKRKEHLYYMKSQLLELCSNHTASLLSTVPGAKLLIGVMNIFRNISLEHHVLELLCQTMNQSCIIFNKEKKKELPVGLAIVLNGWCSDVKLLSTYFNYNYYNNSNNTGSGSGSSSGSSSSSSRNNDDVVVTDSLALQDLWEVSPDTTDTTITKSKRNANDSKLYSKIIESLQIFIDFFTKLSKSSSTKSCKDGNILYWINFNPACHFLSEMISLQHTALTQHITQLITGSSSSLSVNIKTNALPSAAATAIAGVRRSTRARRTRSDSDMSFGSQGSQGSQSSTTPITTVPATKSSERLKERATTVGACKRLAEIVGIH